MTDYQDIPSGLRNYIENEILPLYRNFDAAHQQDHAQMVIEQSLELARMINRGELDIDGVTQVSIPMVYTIAACHDLGIAVDRKTHHLHSAEIVRQDERLRQWFTSEKIEIIAQATEDHRASSCSEPRSIYGKIVSEADRKIIPETIILRTVQYGLDNYADLDRERQWQRTIEHLQKKYARGGYLKLWFAGGANHRRLEKLQDIISNDLVALRNMFDQAYDKEMERRQGENTKAKKGEMGKSTNDSNDYRDHNDNRDHNTMRPSETSVYQSEAWRQMTSGQPYDATQQILIKELIRVRTLIARYNNTDPEDTESLTSQLHEILGRCGKNVCVVQPFRCDYGKNIFVGDNTYINFNLTVLDEAKVSIGSSCFLGPNISIYTPCHPLTPKKRNTGQEWSLEVTIGDNCWLGGNVVLLPGVHIGDYSVIGAGSVVTKDVPSGQLWAGNPARFIKEIDLEEDK